MSLSAQDFAALESRSFRQISRDRLLNEMLRVNKDNDPRSQWRVLIMDKFTVKVMSYSCKMADITEAGISLVEDVFKRREPLPSMDAIYFMQPLKENVIMLLSDMSGRCPLYRKVYVFFSSPIPKDLVAYIKNDPTVVPRIGALSEMNLEYFAIDNQAFVTDHEMALEDLFGANVENTRKFNECLITMATRLATVFASLRELPYVRYRAKSNADTASPIDAVPSKLATAVWDMISRFKKTIPEFPQKETCELLILDRSIDQIAPFIHEWTYDAMCHDLLEMDGNKCVVEMPKKSGGDPEMKEVILEEHDTVWLELRHAHIADASERLHDKMTNFASKNKAAQIQGKSRDEISTKDMQKLVQALPQYTEQMEKLTLHVEIAGKINSIIREQGLRELGQLEQDLIFGDAGAKEVINFLRARADASPENKLRLLMIYAIVYPEKFEGDSAAKLMQLAKLSQDDMNAIKNLRYLGGDPETKKSSGGGGFSLKFDSSAKNKKNAARKERDSELQTWALTRFYPLIEDLIEKISKGELSKQEFSCLNEPPPLTSNSSQQPSTSARTGPTQQPVSRRSRRTPGWAARGSCSDDGYSSDSVLKQAAGEYKRLGQRIFIFVIGGATRSELRAVHNLSVKLKREIILGTSSLDDPPRFITKLKLFGTNHTPPAEKVQLY